ncbi:J domain-containing protein [Sulfidibacter corallicola]
MMKPFSRLETTMSMFDRLKDIVRANAHAIRTHEAVTRILGQPQGGTGTADRQAHDTSHFDQDLGGTSSDRSYGHATGGGGPQEDPDLARYYANLEVPYGSDLETVRAARKKLLRKYHPDLHNQSAEKRKVAEELTQQINIAYRELEKRLKT